MILSEKQFEADTPKPGEEARVAASDPARDVPEQDIADNLWMQEAWLLEVAVIPVRVVALHAQVQVVRDSYVINMVVYHCQLNWYGQTQKWNKIPKLVEHILVYFS